MAPPSRHTGGGLIPAHAGKTYLQRLQRSETGAHPRSRGENTDEQAARAGDAGSSPLTRGKRKGRRNSGPPGRLIPAHAGKTPAGMIFRASMRAHPRSRGENSSSPKTPPTRAGSSPLTRGKQEVRLAVRLPSGLIPAHAGKTRRVPHRRILREGLIPAHAGKTLPDLRFYRADRSDLGKP